MTPHSESLENRYSRLFAPAPAKPSGDDAYKLLTLVIAMSRLEAAPVKRPIPAGYTYFGQFFDHDLTRNEAELKDAWNMPFDKVENGQSSRLDLDHLYGAGPLSKASGFLYGDDDMSFRVGGVTSRNTSFDVGWRLARNPDETTGLLLADRRSSENVVIRQIAAVFARLHNLAVSEFKRRSNDKALVFQWAREKTTEQFRWLVWYDYLQRVLDEDVYAAVFQRGEPPRFEWNKFTVPIEFAAAAMRFGHSMVREGYQLSDRKDVSLKELVGACNSPDRLDEIFEIDWNKFFELDGSPVSADPIDTVIARPLYQLPPDTIGLFVRAKMEKQNLGFPAWLEPFLGMLPLRTLLRGAIYQLPSGQAVAGALGISPLTAWELTHNLEGEETPDGKVLGDNDWLADNTPLWYYILKESEMRDMGRRLGATGSIIIAETVAAAFRHDQTSRPYGFPPEGPVLPPVWEGLPGGPRRLPELLNLFQVAKSLPLPLD